MVSKTKAARRTRKAKGIPVSLANELGPRGCSVKAKGGKLCGAPAINGTAKCIMHSSDNAVRLGIKGGHRRTIFDPAGLVAFDPPKTAADLKELFAQSIIEIRAAKLDPKLANSISYLGMAFLKALELSDHESRLDEIEKHIAGDQG
jgi:hypothetical protein